MVSKTSASSLSGFSDCTSKDNIRLGFGAKMAEVTTALCAGEKNYFRITNKLDSKHQDSKICKKYNSVCYLPNSF